MSNNSYCHSLKPPIDPLLFSAIQRADIDVLANQNITPVLPLLAKLICDSSISNRQDLIKLLHPIRQMNIVIDLMSIPSLTQIMTTQNNSTHYESSNGAQKLQIVMTALMDLSKKVRSSDQFKTQLVKTYLFDNPVYHDELSYCLCVALFKAPLTSVINIIDVCETLLHVRDGPAIICRLVANMPDRSFEVCISLINYADQSEELSSNNEINKNRAIAVRLICQMNPAIALAVRSEAIGMRKLPSLVLMITIDSCHNAIKILKVEGNNISYSENNHIKSQEMLYGHSEDGFDSAISFVNDILLEQDEATRLWFAQYIKSTQKLNDLGTQTILSEFRTQLHQFIQTHLVNKFFRDDFSLNNHHESNSNGDIFAMFDDKVVTFDANKLVIRATAVLRMFCALRGIGGMKINDQESIDLLRLITIRLPANQTCANFAITGMCTLLACSSIIVNQKDEKLAANWLKWCIHDSGYNKYSTQGKCSISDLFLLIAILFQNNQNARIAELVCATLEMKLQIKASVSKSKSLFVQEVMNDQAVTEHASQIPVTKNLNNNIVEFLPVHCIHQLLENRSFSKHQVEIKDWIFKQICQSVLPLHNIMPKLIETYVNSVIVSTSVYGHCGTNQKFSHQEIALIFKNKLYMSREQNTPNGISHTINCLSVNNESESSTLSASNIEVACYLTSQMLMLYYLLLYEDTRLKKNPDMSVIDRTKVIKYDTDFMMEIPIHFLLQIAYDNQESFGPIVPGLMKLVAANYPQLCLAQQWLCLDGSNDNSVYNLSSKISELSLVLIKSQNKQKDQVAHIKTEISEKQISDAYLVIERDPSKLGKIMNNINSSHILEQWKYAEPIISKLGKLLSLIHRFDDETKVLFDTVFKFWWKLNSVYPRKLWVITVNSLRRTENMTDDKFSSMEYKWIDLVSDPLIVLRCDKHVFRCPQLLSINLYILSALLAASRRYLHDQISENPGPTKDLAQIKSREELAVALIAAQTSASIQILLEYCLPTSEEEKIVDVKDDEGKDLTENDLELRDRYNNCVNLICENLHQAFIVDTNLAKLVHFQTYPNTLLSLTADKIPSMHICLDFIPEMLVQPDLKKQAFVIELTSHLCEKYPITKSLTVAKLCFNTAFTLLQVLSSKRRAMFFLIALPALLRISKVFPILKEDASIILRQMKNITQAHVTSTASRFGLNSSKSATSFNEVSWKDLKRIIMSNFTLQEALQICIDICLKDLSEIDKSF